MVEPVTIRPVDGPEALESILPLIAGYQRFYEQTPDDTRNREFFARIGSAERPGRQLAAFDGTGRAIGFVTLYVVPSSLTAMPYCLLNDLFTEPDCRGHGVGRALIEAARAHARTLGFTELEWVTHVDNTTAQRLYDGIGATRSAWYTYTLPAEG